MPPSNSLPPPPDTAIQRALSRNVAAGFLGSVWIAVANGMALPLLMEALKVSGFQLGILTAARQFSTLAQVPAACLGENLPQRKPAWALLCGTHRVLWICPALLPWLLPQSESRWPFLIIAALGVSELLANCSASLWFSWMADLVPHSNAGRFWGQRQRILSISLLLSSLLFGGLLQQLKSEALLGFQIVFAAAAVFGVADILLHLTVHEPAPTRLPRRPDFWKSITRPWQHPPFRQLTLAMGAWTAAVTMPGYLNGLPSFFSIVYLKEALDATYLQASGVFAASALGGILWTPRIGAWVDRYGAARTAFWLMLLGPLISLAWLWVGPTPIAFGKTSIPLGVLVGGAASLLLGGAYAGVTLCQMRLTQELTAPEGRTVAMGLHLAVVGTLGAIGALSAGWIKDHLTLPAFQLGPALAPFSYFQVLILIQAGLAWGIAAPLISKLCTPQKKP
jgi:hypothetical protein